MTREEWRASLPDPIRPGQIVERLNNLLAYVETEATELLTSKQVNTPRKLADAQRDAIKLRDGAQAYAQNAPDMTFPLDSGPGKQGVAIGLRLFDGLDELRKATGNAPALDPLVNPAARLRDIASGAKKTLDSLPTVVLLAGLLYLAHRYGDD